VRGIFRKFRTPPPDRDKAIEVGKEQRALYIFHKLEQKTFFLEIEHYGSLKEQNFTLKLRKSAPTKS